VHHPAQNQAGVDVQHRDQIQPALRSTARGQVLGFGVDQRRANESKLPCAVRPRPVDPCACSLRWVADPEKRASDLIGCNDLRQQLIYL
jgi:hypothetical protein